MYMIRYADLHSNIRTEASFRITIPFVTTATFEKSTRLYDNIIVKYRGT
jgi:hypothetical protein